VNTVFVKNGAMAALVIWQAVAVQPSKTEMVTKSHLLVVWMIATEEAFRFQHETAQ